MSRITARAVIRVVALALAGLAVAAALAVAASRLSSQRIGLSSEPSSAGNRLAPASLRGSGGGGRPGGNFREDRWERGGHGRHGGPGDGNRPEDGEAQEGDD